MTPKHLISTALTTTALLACVGSSAGCDAEDAAHEPSDLRIVMNTPPTDELATTEVEPVDDVRLTFRAIELHHVDEGWITIDPADGDAELYFGEAPLALAHDALPEGRYDQLRAIIDEAEVFIGDDAHPLDVPSGKTSGFEVHGEFCVFHHHRGHEADGHDASEHRLELRWNHDEGIHHSDERGYWLEPSVSLGEAPSCPEIGTAPANL